MNSNQTSNLRAPTITTQPTSQTVTAGQTATFTVRATGTAPLSYQWQKNGAVISGATSSGYATPATTSSDNGAQFTVIVSNSAGSTTSNAALLTVNSPPSQLTPTPTSANFGNVVTGTSASQTISLNNSGSASVTISSASVSGTGFSITGLAVPLTLTAGQNTTFTAQFAPSSTGSASGSISITSNAPGSPLAIALTGAGVAPSYLLGANPTTLAFGNVSVGGNSSLSTTLTNNGNSNVTISSVTASGAGFSASGVTAGTILTPNQSATLNVAFAPTAPGSVTGSVTVTSNATNSPASISLSATGAATPPTVAISSPTNGATVSGTITVSGTASDSLGISSVAVQVDGGAFSPASGTTSWTFALDTTSLSNATHTLTARATDTLGTTASTSVSVSVSNSASGPVINVKNYGATGNGSTDDTVAINSAIAALTPSATLLFPCGTYLTTSLLTLNRVSNITIDGSSCATIHNTSSATVMVIGGSGNGNPNYGSAVSLAATANELSTGFSTVSSLGVSPGDYVLLQQGGMDSSTGSGNTGCDPSGCRGELLKVASVSGNTITVTTALHDTFNPSVNNATAQKMLGPLAGVTVKNISFDGNGSNVYGLGIAGVSDSTVSGVTVTNVQGAALLNRGDFNVSWSNINVTHAGSAQCGSAVWFENQGNLQVNGLSISNENPGASGTGCLYNGAFGFEFIASANSTITNLTVDAAGAYGRPMKTTAARYNTFNSITVKNGVQNYNGISLEYYSSHNTYNNCTVTNNGAGTGTGTGNAGINLFGNFNQYNSFNNCTVSGNGNIQVLVNSFDALRLSQDSNNTFSGGTYTGTNNVEPVIYLEGANPTVIGVTINGSGSNGITTDYNAANACINNNTFASGTGLLGAISVGFSSDIGSGNILNGLSSNLTPGSCGP